MFSCRWSSRSCYQPGADRNGWNECEKKCVHYWSYKQVMNSCFMVCLPLTQIILKFKLDTRLKHILIVL